MGLGVEELGSQLLSFSSHDSLAFALASQTNQTSFHSPPTPPTPFNITMKFITAFVALATVVTAMPSCGGYYQNQNTRVSQSFLKGLDDPKHPPLCWLVCWATEPNCPDGWYSESMDDIERCWTCCMDNSENH
ncbi:hypothetical protein AB1N83_010611 [Pleurotus pulmonarius]